MCWRQGSLRALRLPETHGWGGRLVLALRMGGRSSTLRIPPLNPNLTYPTVCSSAEGHSSGHSRNRCGVPGQERSRKDGRLCARQSAADRAGRRRDVCSGHVPHPRAGVPDPQRVLPVHQVHADRQDVCVLRRHPDPEGLRNPRQQGHPPAHHCRDSGPSERLGPRQEAPARQHPPLHPGRVRQDARSSW